MLRLTGRTNSDGVVKVFSELIFALALVAVGSGCQTFKYTSFTPLDARLEPGLGGGALYFVLVNTSGRPLHNYSFSAYLWNEHDQRARLRKRPVRRYLGSGSELGAGK